MQKIPWLYLAYRKFSIFRLQLRQREQEAQKAWSPVSIARSSIFWEQALHEYVQLLQISDPSPSNSRLGSESSEVPHVLQRKQSKCQEFPTACVSVDDFY